MPLRRCPRPAIVSHVQFIPGKTLIQARTPETVNPRIREERYSHMRIIGKDVQNCNKSVISGRSSGVAIGVVARSHSQGIEI